MNRFMRVALPGAVLALMLSIAAVAGDTADPLVGDWQLDREKSTFVPEPGPKGQLRSYRIKDGVEKMTARGVDAQGKPTLVHYTARYDGKDYDIKGSLGGDKIVLRRIDARTTESTQKRGGKPAIVATRSVSPDGKTLTVISRGTTAEGEVIDTTMHFDKR